MKTRVDVAGKRVFGAESLVLEYPPTFGLQAAPLDAVEVSECSMGCEAGAECRRNLLGRKVQHRLELGPERLF